MHIHTQIYIYIYICKFCKNYIKVKLLFFRKFVLKELYDIIFYFGFFYL